MRTTEKLQKLRDALQTGSHTLSQCAAGQLQRPAQPEASKSQSPTQPDLGTVRARAQAAAYALALAGHTRESLALLLALGRLEGRSGRSEDPTLGFSVSPQKGPTP